MLFRALTFSRTSFCGRRRCEQVASGCRAANFSNYRGDAARVVRSSVRRAASESTSSRGIRQDDLRLSLNERRPSTATPNSPFPIFS